MVRGPQKSFVSVVVVVGVVGDGVVVAVVSVVGVSRSGSQKQRYGSVAGVVSVVGDGVAVVVVVVVVGAPVSTRAVTK